MTDNRFRDGKLATTDLTFVGLSKVIPTSLMSVALLKAETSLSMDDTG
jgi:hypothetical protein